MPRQVDELVASAASMSAEAEQASYTAASASETGPRRRKTVSDYKAAREADTRFDPGAKDRARWRINERKRRADIIEAVKEEARKKAFFARRKAEAKHRQLIEQRRLMETTLKAADLKSEAADVTLEKGDEQRRSIDDLDVGAGIAQDDMEMILDMVLPRKSRAGTSLVPAREDPQHDVEMRKALAQFPARAEKVFSVTTNLAAVMRQGIDNARAMLPLEDEGVRQQFDDLASQDDVELLRRLLVRRPSPSAKAGAEAELLGDERDAKIVNWFVDTAEGMDNAQMLADVEALQRASGVFADAKVSETQVRADVEAIHRLIGTPRDWLEAENDVKALCRLAPYRDGHRYIGCPGVDALSDAALVAAWQKGKDLETQDVELLHRLLFASESADAEQRDRDVDLIYKLAGLAHFGSHMPEDWEILNSARAREDDAILCELADLPRPLKIDRGRESPSSFCRSNPVLHSQLDQDVDLLQRLLATA